MDKTTRKKLERQAETNPNAKMALDAARLRERRGGTPKCFVTDDGKMGFRYPDGTVTVNGRVVS